MASVNSDLTLLTSILWEVCNKTKHGAHGILLGLPVEVQQQLFAVGFWGCFQLLCVLVCKASDNQD